MISRNVMYHYDADRLIFSVQHNFPSYDLVENGLFNKLAKRRHRMLKWVCDAWMLIKNIDIRDKINGLGYNPDTIIRDFNKIVRELLNEPSFELMD